MEPFAHLTAVMDLTFCHFLSVSLKMLDFIIFHGVMEAKMMSWRVQIVCCPGNSRFAHLAAILIDVTFVAFNLCLLKRKYDVSIKTDRKKTEVNVESMIAARCTKGIL